MISGFIIPYVARNETRFEFCVKRIARIYPVFFVSIVFYALLKLVTNHSILSFDLTPEGLFLSLTFLNFFFDVPAINDIAWTLVVEVLFYIWIAMNLHHVYRRPHLVIVLTASLSALAIFCAYQGFAINFFKWLIPVNFMFLGTLIYLRWSVGISRHIFFLSSAFFWIAFLVGLNITSASFERVAALPISYGLAYIIFGLFFLSEHCFRKLDPITAFLSHTSYSIYLYHNRFGIILLSALLPIAPYSTALVLVFGLILVMSYFSWKYIEHPFQKWARAFITKRSASSVATMSLLNR